MNEYDKSEETAIGVALLRALSICLRAKYKKNYT